MAGMMTKPDKNQHKKNAQAVRLDDKGASVSP